MKLSIHRLLEKIRFHVNQLFENFLKTFSHLISFFYFHNSVSYLHTNLLTVIDTEKQSEIKFVFVLAGLWSNHLRIFLQLFLIIYFRHKPQCHICLDLSTNLKLGLETMSSWNFLKTTEINCGPAVSFTGQRVSTTRLSCYVIYGVWDENRPPSGVLALEYFGSF